MVFCCQFSTNFPRYGPETRVFIKWFDHDIILNSHTGAGSAEHLDPVILIRKVAVKLAIIGGFAA